MIMKNSFVMSSRGEYRSQHPRLQPDFAARLRDAEVQPRRPEPDDVPKALPAAAPIPGVSGFVPVQLPALAETPAPPGDIRMEVRRGAVQVVVTWPAALAGQCGGWLRDLLR